jgi:hypothetical protein
MPFKGAGLDSTTSKPSPNFSDKVPTVLAKSRQNKHVCHPERIPRSEGSAFSDPQVSDRCPTCGLALSFEGFCIWDPGFASLSVVRQRPLSLVSSSTKNLVILRSDCLPVARRLGDATKDLNPRVLPPIPERKARCPILHREDRTVSPIHRAHKISPPLSPRPGAAPLCLSRVRV